MVDRNLICYLFEKRFRGVHSRLVWKWLDRDPGKLRHW